MTVLGIFTVKKLVQAEGTFWTYGGFGKYLSGMQSAFERVVLFAHVKQSAPCGYMYPLDISGINVVRLPWPENELQALLYSYHTFRAARAQIRSCDLIHARMPDMTGILGAYVATEMGVPMFASIVADWRLQARTLQRTGVLAWLLRQYMITYDLFERRVCRGRLVFAQGVSSYQRHCETADTHLMLSTAHEAADVVVEPRERCLREPLVLLCVGRLTGEKNHRLAIDILEYLRRVDRREWTLWIVGSGPHREELEEYAKQKTVARWVQFHGSIRHGAALWAVYDQADILLHPSLSEGTPKVILEAMARGLPVVASRVGGVESQIVDGENGLLFETGAVEGAVQQVMRVVDSGELRDRIVKKGTDTARKVCVEEEMRKMLTIVAERWPGLDIGEGVERSGDGGKGTG